MAEEFNSRGNSDSDSRDQWAPSSGQPLSSSYVTPRMTRNKKLELENQMIKEGLEFESFNKTKETSDLVKKYIGITKDDYTADMDFEEGIRFFEYTNDKVKVYWTLPLRSFIKGEGKSKLESLIFPTSWSRRWNFIANVTNDAYGIKEMYIGLQAILDESEKENPGISNCTEFIEEWGREVNVSFKIVLKLKSQDLEKGFNRRYNANNLDSGIQLPEMMLDEMNLHYNDCLIIECTIKENRNLKQEESIYCGLINSGNLCYMNSFLQTLYHLPIFQRIIYKAPFEAIKEEGLTLLAALQKLFYGMRFSKRALSTSELIKSFGWDRRQANIQQDVQEFCTLFLDSIEKKYKAMDISAKDLSNLFEGKTLNYIRCVEVNHRSERIEKFSEIQLMVKGMSSIYESLDSYIQEELLDEENRYDAGEKYGKQIAYRGIKFYSLPPVLMIQLKRFEYDFTRDSMNKISDSCEFYDEIDLSRYVDSGYKRSTQYKLFSVLVHSGASASSGHYYSFIRPRFNAPWYKFNDDIVDFAEPQEVFESNFGGFHVEARLNAKREIETWESANHASAYMLVYIQVDHAKQILNPIGDEEIPRKLIEEIETNKRLEEDKRRKNEEYVKIYMTSMELIKDDLKNPGLIFYKMGTKDDDFANRFLKAKGKRFKVCIKKTFKVTDLIQFISDITKIPAEELVIWKIAINKEQITPVTKKTFISGTGTTIQVLANGVGNTTKSVFFVHTLNRNKYPKVFKTEQPYHSNYYEIKCKNVVSFIEYEQDEEMLSGELTERRILNRAGSVLLELLEEQYFIVFVKAYNWKNGVSQLRLWDFFLIRKNSRVSDLVDEIQSKYNQADFSNAFYSREDKKRYTLVPLTLDDPIDDESAESGFVFVVEFTKKQPGYVTSVEYYENLAQRVWVTITPHEDGIVPVREILDSKMKFDEFVALVSDKIYGSEIAPNKILIKAKWKFATSYSQIQYTDSTNLTLGDLVKHDEKVQCEISQIEVDLIDKTVKSNICYYSSVTNHLTAPQDIFLDKTAKVCDLIQHIEENDYFATERMYDVQYFEEEANMRILVINKKEERIIGRAALDNELEEYPPNKFRLICSIIPQRYQSSADKEDKYYPIYCCHFTKDNKKFSNPFLMFSQKSSSGEQFRFRLLNLMKNWEIFCYDKEIKMSSDYFSKLRLIVKNDNEKSYSTVEDNDSYPFQELEENAKKFKLDIIHPFNMPQEQNQMKIKS